MISEFVLGKKNQVNAVEEITYLSLFAPNYNKFLLIPLTYYLLPFTYSQILICKLFIVNSISLYYNIK